MATEPPLRQGLSLYVLQPGKYVLMDVRDRDRQRPLGLVARGDNGNNKRWFTQAVDGTVVGPYRKRIVAINALAREAGFK